VAARSKAWFCGRSLAGILGLNPAGWHGYLSLVNIMYCQVEASMTSWLLVQRSPTECGTSLHDTVKLRWRRGHGPRWAAVPRRKKLLFYLSRRRDLNDCDADRLYRLTMSLIIALSIGITSVDTPAPHQFFNLSIRKIHSPKHFARFTEKTMEKA